LTDDPQSRVARFDFARFLFDQGESVEALKLLNELITGNPNEVGAWQFGAQIALSAAEYFEFAADWTGEAIKHFPDHPAILLQRAEALLLASDAEQALPLWTRAHSPKSARHLAALVLCELVAGDCHRAFSPADEKSVSHEFLKWYRQLLTARAHSLTGQVNEAIDALRAILPTFVAAWESAMKESHQPAHA
jgi:tetratricopeptide (TPR) repeat protein